MTDRAIGRERRRQWIGGAPEPQYRRSSPQQVRKPALVPQDCPPVRAYCQSWRIGRGPHSGSPPQEAGPQGEKRGLARVPRPSSVSHRSVVRTR